MAVNIPYMEHLGILKSIIVFACASGDWIRAFNTSMQIVHFFCLRDRRTPCREWPCCIGRRCSGCGESLPVISNSPQKPLVHFGPCFFQFILRELHETSWDCTSGWWFGTCFIFPYIENVIIPIDFHIFRRGRVQTTSQKKVLYIFPGDFKDRYQSLFTPGCSEIPFTAPQ